MSNLQLRSTCHHHFVRNFHSTSIADFQLEFVKLILRTSNFSYFQVRASGTFFLLILNFLACYVCQPFSFLSFVCWAFHIDNLCLHLSRLVQTCQKLVQTCPTYITSPNLVKDVQTYPNLVSLVQTRSKLYKLGQTCSNLSKLGQTCPNLSKLVQTWSNLSRLVQTCPNFVKLV